MCKKMERARVLHIIESTGKSGPRYILLSLLKELDQNKFQVDLACAALRDRDFRQDIEEIKKLGIKVFIIKMKRQISLFSDLLVFFQLCIRIKKGSYDIVHTHSSKAGFLGRLAARFMGVRRVIHTPHCFSFLAEGLTLPRRLFYFSLEKFAALFCDCLVAVSESQRQDMLNKGLARPEKVVTIANSVDVRRFAGNGLDIARKKQELGIYNGALILGAVGVLNESKGHRYLIRAVSELVREGLDVQLIIAGEGELRADLESLSQKLGLDSRVKLLGFRKDIPQLLGIVDIFVFPSLWEGMPLAILEAMASGLPVICTEVHGAVDLIQGDQRGILVKKRESEAIVDAIRYLIANPNQANKIGQEARRFVCENYTLARYISKIERLYLSA